MMNLPSTRAVLCGLLALLSVALVCLPRELAAQKVVPLPAPVDPIEPGTPGEERELLEKLSYPEDRDTNQKFEAVTDYLKAKNPDWAVVARLAQGLLDAKSDYFYQYNANNPDPKADRRRVSVKDEINRLIGTFPKDGRDFYELTYGTVASDLLKQAKASSLDMTRLSEVSQRFFHTKAGGEATVLLASLQLELGNYPESAYNFARLLTRPESDQILDSKNLFRAVVAFKRAGEGKIPESGIGIWDKIEKKIPRDGLQLGRKLYNLDQLKAEADRPIEFLYGKVGEAFVAMKGVNASRAGVADAGAPFLDPVFSIPTLFRTENPVERSGADWVRQQIDVSYNQARVDSRKVPIPAVFPVTAPNRILFRGYDGTYAFFSKDCIDELGKPRRAGELAWFSPTKAGAQTLFAEEDESARSERPSVQNYWQTYWMGQMPSILYENALLGSLSHDGKLAYYIDDIAVPPQPTGMAGDPWGGFPPPGMDQQGPRGLKDFNRLIAVDVETGLTQWHLGGISPPLKPEDEEKVNDAATLLQNSFFLGAPLPLNGKLYCLVERDGNLKLVCLDPLKTQIVRGVGGRPGPTKSPELIWVQNLGRTNVPLKQDPFRRIQGAFLASSEGVMLCPTNTGAMIAVDINARSLLWAHTYSAISKEDVPLPGPRGRLPRPVNNTIQHDRWRSSAPIISNSRAIVTAYDCDQVQCLDLRTGRLLWSEPRKIDDLYVGGIAGNKVVIVGKSSIRAVQLTGERADRKSIPAWKDEVRIGTPCGHGVMSKDGVFYVPVIGEPDNKDSQLPAVWAINTETGTIISKTAFRTKKELGRPGSPGSDSRLMLGNLVFHDGLMFSQSATELTAFPLIEVKKREMNDLLTKNPNDPEGLTSRGELLLDQGNLADAIADFKKAEANKPNESTSRKIKQKLYIAYTEILRNKFTDGESFLDEYKVLCEFPIDENLTAEERSRQIEEQNRRKGLYHTLMAKGREQQGRLVDAFDNYRAFALLGQQRQLVPVPDDANTMARSDIWARGRIEAMIRNAKDPAVRKPLEEKISKEWEAVRQANDLPRLRDYVKVFGPFFETGVESQFHLAEQLLKTGNAEDVKESEQLLFNLLAQSLLDKDRRESGARAAELLARVMSRRGMMDDSIGLYQMLGEQYSDVVIRDGKTGSEIFGDLVTDKRFLPYLEPSRGVSLSQYKIEATIGGGAQRSNTISSKPEGDLLAFYNRYRVSIESDPNSGWVNSSLRVVDKQSGEDYLRSNILPGLQTINGYPITAAEYDAVQASGHMILVHIGQFVYCFDLSQKGNREPLWKLNLLGANGVIMNMQTPNNQATSEKLSDGDTAVGLANGDTWRFRMGRSSIIQPGYAAVITRDGMMVVDPKTGTKLWTRANIPSKSLIFGDARHIYLVEPNSGGATGRVFRATDGASIEGVKDFGNLVAGSNRLAILGQQIVSKEITENELVLKLYDILENKDVWTKKYPKASHVIKTTSTDTVGVLTEDGKIELIATQTGKSIVNDTVVAHRFDEHIKEKGKFVATNPLLLSDRERYFVFLSRPADNQNQVNWWGYQPVRRTSVNGPCYCFDRNTGKLLWYTDSHFKDQQIMLEQFEDTPCIVAGNHNNEDLPPGRVPNPGQPGAHYRVVVLDKQDGSIKHMKNYQQGSMFQWVNQDKSGAIEFGSYNLRVRITPDQSAKK